MRNSPSVCHLQQIKQLKDCHQERRHLKQDASAKLSYRSFLVLNQESDVPETDSKLIK